MIFPFLPFMVSDFFPELEKDELGKNTVTAPSNVLSHTHTPHTHTTHTHTHTHTHTSTGKKAGYIGSAYFLGNFLGSLFWGWASDFTGRRPVMLLGLCGPIIFELMFGLSQNFGWAVATRFMWGMLNGNVGIGKTYIAEVRCMLQCRTLV